MSALWRVLGVAITLAAVSVTAPARAGSTVGGFDDGFVGCDNAGACSIALDEAGNISGTFGGFFGPYSVSLTQITASTDAAYAGLEVVSYEVVGKGGSAPIRLIGGALGLCDFGVSADGLSCGLLGRGGGRRSKGRCAGFQARRYR